MIRAASHSPVHLEFAVGSRAEGYEARNGVSKTSITVQIPYQLEGKDRIDGATGYDAMLVVERAVLSALQTSDWGTLNPRLASISEIACVREPGPDGWIWLVVTLTALHPSVT